MLLWLAQLSLVCCKSSNLLSLCAYGISVGASENVWKIVNISNLLKICPNECSKHA